MKEKTKHYNKEIYEQEREYELIKVFIISFLIGLITMYIAMQLQIKEYQNEINRLTTKVVMYEHSIYDGGYENANM